MTKRCLLLVTLALLAAPAHAANLIVNPSFEFWLLGNPLPWLTSNIIAESSVVQDTNAHSGEYCALLSGADTSAFVATTTVVRPGYNYRFAGFCRVPGLVGGSFVLQWTTLLAEPIGSPVLIPVVYSGASYREYSRWLTAPDSAALIAVSFATLPQTTVYLDDVTLEDTTIAAVGEEPPFAPQVRAAVRKFVCPLSAPVSPNPNPVLYDPLGRRVVGRPRPGVYFISPAGR
jgi:hypothetical protein